MRRRRLIELLVVRWGFAAMVVTAIVAGGAVGVTVGIPTEVPSVALGAEPVYRLEVGASVFFGLYIASMALALSLQNRAFTEIGTGGVRARDLATTAESLASDEALMEVLLDLTKEVNDLQTWQEAGRNVD